MKDKDESDSKQNAGETLAAKKDKENKPSLKKDDAKKTNLEPKIKTNTKPETSKDKENLFNAKPIPKMGSVKSKKNIFVPTIIFILLILLFALSGWIFYQQLLTTDSLQSLSKDLKTELEQQSAQVSGSAQINKQINNEMTQLKQGFQSLANYNNDLKLQLNSAQEKIKSLSGRRKQDWMLAEVEYLVDIAVLKLSLQKDKNTALQLLKTADDRLIEISDQSLMPIREAIARDISSLNLIQESDITGIVITLNAIDQQISQLDLLALKFDEASIEISNESSATIPSNIENNDESSVDLSEIYKRFVNEFIVIKEHAETPQPLMTPNQRGNLNQNIRLALQQAQMAALQGNEQLYAVNLDKSINWIVQYFGEGADVSSIVKQLSDLKLEKIDVRYPTQLESAKEIETSKKNQLYNWLGSNLNPSTKKPDVNSTSLNSEGLDSEKINSEKVDSKKTDPEKIESEESKQENDQGDSKQ